MSRAPLRLLALMGVLVAAGCRPSAELAPDERYGHRPDEAQQTLLIRPPDSTLTYYTYTAYFDTLHVRVGPPAVGETARPVEVLVKGALPDGCTELAGVEQERAGHLVTVALTTRRPRGAVCPQVVRPFRFYLDLDGRYEPGAYTLKVNDVVHPFMVRPPEDAE